MVPVLLWIVVASWTIGALVCLLAPLPLIPVFMVLIGKNTRTETAEAQAELHRLGPTTSAEARARPARHHRSGP